MTNKIVVVFDLDDTLYYEIDFLKSAYKEIAQYIVNSGVTKLSITHVFEDMLNAFKNNDNVFKNLINTYKSLDLSINDLLYKYRSHIPNISLSEDTVFILNYLKENNVEMAIITDGRSKQQRSKIKALGLDKYTNTIIISEEIGSEKPNLANYKYVEEKFADKNVDFYYVGDNLKKDFVTPNKLDWVTVCLKDKGFNIHSQSINVPSEYKPNLTIESLYELKDIIFK